MSLGRNGWIARAGLLLAAGLLAGLGGHSTAEAASAGLLGGKPDVTGYHHRDAEAGTGEETSGGEGKNHLEKESGGEEDASQSQPFIPRTLKVGLPAAEPAQAAPSGAEEMRRLRQA
ncbi:hypothetical protein J31TS4_47080 [Paenibacillus sp. J31TS4]|uniref:hypothetical protein n=1 Tax=Paenibacillus sp. J31TS4 TaxID=2807195 RepID=UPI001B114474|nr:hypothetical protein [Paenibacillus sp. J31TS4]GIP41428.1 hypothetical protein J31TS4_47080 [Paenibacillus sp. J31TS4]